MEGQQEIIENMQAAGCPETEISSFVACCESGELKKGMKILSGCRKEILARIHEEQRKIDCLDYLAYQIQRQN